VDELRGMEMSPLTDLPMRLATTADAALVTRLLKAFFSHEGRVVPHLSENVEAILDDPGRGFFTLAGDRGVATTTIRISAGGGASAEIEEIWVQPSARGQGLGSKLLRTAVSECRRRGIESIELRVTPDDQELGIPDFYTKQGFLHGGRLIYEYSGLDTELRRAN
jgi:GNAT superfamily N-acetyltransferase